MSIENHPNINAAGLTADIMESFLKRLRGKAAEDKQQCLKCLHNKLIEFVSDISSVLDNEFGT